MSESGIEILLANVARMLGLIDTQDLGQHVKSCRQSLSRAGSLGAMIDPTGYRNALQSGQIESAKYQLKIAEALLEARKAIDVLEEFVAQRLENGELG